MDGPNPTLVYHFLWQGIRINNCLRDDNFVLHIYPLRLVSSNKSSTDGEYCTFCIRTGTSKGVVNRVFRAECERDLTSWARALVTGTHNCVAGIREAAWGIDDAFCFSCLTHYWWNRNFADCLWRGQEARLYLHYEDGLKLYPATEIQYGEKPLTQPVPFWKASFGNLRHSADDGVRTLWLDIGTEDGEMVSVLSFKNAVMKCTIYSFHCRNWICLRVQSHLCLRYIRFCRQKSIVLDW